MITVFLLTVMLGNNVVNRDLYFENINNCLYFASKLNNQTSVPTRDIEKNDRITAYCLPITVDKTKVKVYK
jgi:xanthine dehydrogenase iron-sulfur cluster and FAD-binding subunit A